MLRCESIRVVYGSTPALDDVGLEVADGEVVAVMGESGSGKTTLLRVIAGLVKPDQGSIAWGDRTITSDPIHVRRFGLMFQDYALFPHLTVGDNVAFGLRMQGHSAPAQQETVARMLEMVGLTGYAERSVAGLSGGEQQRVALARTLAPEPELVLLDEPLGALDRARRDQLLADMQRIFADLGVTALYVTHDHNEAFAVADDVVVLDGGRKVAQGTPSELWANPGHTAVATLLGFPILRDISVRDRQAHIGSVTTPVELADGDHHLALHPGAVVIDPEGPVPVTVHARRFEDGFVKAVTEIMGVEILAIAPTGVELGPTRATIDKSPAPVVDG